jgi:predicted MFS family arabinose efflux permease
MVSGGLAGYIGQHYGWRSSFFLFGGAGILVVIAAMALLREPRRGLSEQAAPSERLPLAARIRESAGSPTLILHTLAFVGMLLTLTAYLTWTPTLLYRKFGLGLAEAGFHATFWHHLGAMIGAIVGGRIADHWSRRTSLSRPLTQISGLFLATPFIFLLGAAETKMAVLVSLGLFGLFRGFYDSNLFASPYEVIRPQARATATGLMLAVAFLLGGVSPLLTGWLSQQVSLGAALSATSIFYFGAALLLSADALWFFRKGSARLQAVMAKV